VRGKKEEKVTPIVVKFHLERFVGSAAGNPATIGTKRDGFDSLCNMGESHLAPQGKAGGQGPQFTSMKKVKIGRRAAKPTALSAP